MAAFTSDSTSTHDYEIQAGGRTYSGDIVLDLNRSFVHNRTSAEQGIPAVEQTAINTFVTAVSTLYSALRGLDNVTIVVRNTGNKLLKTP